MYTFPDICPQKPRKRHFSLGVSTKKFTYLINPAIISNFKFEITTSWTILKYCYIIFKHTLNCVEPKSFLFEYWFHWNIILKSLIHIDFLWMITKIIKLLGYFKLWAKNLKLSLPTQFIEILDFYSLIVILTELIFQKPERCSRETWFNKFVKI
jgi:hypothetical protein